MKMGLRHLAAIAAGAALLTGLLYYSVILRPANEKRRVLDRHVVRMRSDLSQMIELKSRWDAFLQTRAEAEKMLQQRGKGFSLLAYLEGVCRQLGIDNRIQYMKPLESVQQEGPIKPVGVEMRLSELDVRNLVQFLHRVEHSGQLLSVSRIKIRPAAEEGRRSLELVLQVNTCM